MKMKVFKKPLMYGSGNKFLIWSFTRNDYVEPLSIVSFNTGFNHVALLALDEVVVLSHAGHLLGFRINNRLGFPEIYQNNIQIIERVSNLLEKYYSYSASCKSHSAKLGIGIGSDRVGDYLFQMNGLCDFILKIDPEQRANVNYFVSKKNCFWKPDKIFKEISNNIIWVNDFNELYSKASAEGFKSLVFLNKSVDDTGSHLGLFSDSVRNLQLKNQGNKSRDSAFCLLISLDFEKRIWVNQEDGLRKVITYLREKYDKVTILLNGMTGTEFGYISEGIKNLINNEKIIAENICNELDVNLISLAGMSLSDKCDFISSSDMFIAPIGSASMLPSLVLKKPGLVVGNRSMITEPEYRQYALETVWSPPIDSIKDMADIKGAIRWHKKKETLSYYIDPDGLLDGFKSILDNIDQHLDFQSK